MLHLISAFSLKCYECEPDMERIGKVNVTQNMTQEEYQKIVDSMQFCQNTTNVDECTSVDSCLDLTTGMSFKIPVVNFTINVTTHTVKMYQYDVVQYGYEETCL